MARTRVLDQTVREVREVRKGVSLAAAASSPRTRPRRNWRTFWAALTVGRSVEETFSATRVTRALTSARSQDLKSTLLWRMSSESCGECGARTLVVQFDQIVTLQGAHAERFESYRRSSLTSK